MGPQSLEDVASGEHCVVRAYWRVCYPPKKVGGKVIVNPKTGRPYTLRVQVGGLEVDDGMRVVRHPLAFHGGAAGTFGEIRGKVTHDELGLPSGIEDGNSGVQRATVDEMGRRLAGLVGQEAAARLMATCQGM